MGVSGLPQRLDVREVGPRDGLQIEAPISTEAKIEMIDALVRTGVRRIEATAFVSPRAVPAMADAEDVAAHTASYPDVTWSALVAGVGGAKRAVAAGMTTLEYVVSAAEGHSLANVRRTVEESLALVPEIVGLAHDAGGACEVIIATAWDCPFDGPTPVEHVRRVVDVAVASGADQIVLGDTIGTTTPARVTALLEAVGEWTDLPLGAHFHNTRGVGIANAWAAISAGVTMLDASSSGLGGCPFAPGASGNIATEELVYLLEGSGIETGIDLSAALEAAALVEKLVGHPGDSNLLRAGGPSVPRERLELT